MKICYGVFTEWAVKYSTTLDAVEWDEESAKEHAKMLRDEFLLEPVIVAHEGAENEEGIYAILEAKQQGRKFGIKLHTELCAEFGGTFKIL